MDRNRGEEQAEVVQDDNYTVELEFSVAKEGEVESYTEHVRALN
jgi:hypothetical protein